MLNKSTLTAAAVALVALGLINNVGALRPVANLING